MKFMQKKSTYIAIAATATMLAPLTSQAFETKLSGQVSRMMVLPDDATGDEIQHVDIGWSGTRFRFTGSDTAENGIKYGFRYEIQARTNSAGAVNGGTLGSAGDNQDNRYQDLYVSGDFGKISFGKGDGAGNGGAEEDLSGTALASNAAGIGDNYGGYQVAPGTSFNDVFQIADSLSRQNRVRYDTPSFSGFSLAGSLNQGNATEIAVRYKGKVGGAKVAAAAYVATAPDVSVTVDGDDITGASASVLLDNGLNFTMALSDRENGANNTANDREGTFFKLGYKTGMHAVSIDFGDSERGAGDNREGETTGLTYAFFPHKGVEMFATIRTLDSTNVANSKAVDITAVGGRIKF